MYVYIYFEPNISLTWYKQKGKNKVKLDKKKL